MSNQTSLPNPDDSDESNLPGSSSEWQPPAGGVTVKNYADVPLPDPRERPRHEWACEERRAELLEEIREVGHPDRLPKSQSEYADTYGVTQPMIHKDIQQIRKYLRQTSGSEAIEDIEAIKYRAVMEALEDDNPTHAMELQLKYADFLFDIGRYERAPDRKQVQSVNVDADVSDGLTDEQKEHFEQFSEQLQQATSSNTAKPVDVEATVEEDDDD